MNIKSLTTILAFALALPINITAQVDVNREKYPDYNDRVNPDYTMLQTTAVQNGLSRSIETRGTRPA